MNTAGIVTDEEQIKHYVGFYNSTYGDDGEKSKIFEDNFKDWRCNLRLGDEVYISSETVPKQLNDGEFVTIKPGDFILLLTKEELDLGPNVMGFISMRFDYKQKGLINVSGFHVDPNYKGKLIFSAFNAGPRDIILRKLDPVFMIFFEEMSVECQKKHPGFQHIPATIVEQIQGKSITLSSNAGRLDRMEFYLKLIGGIIITIAVSLFGVAIKALFF